MNDRQGVLFLALLVTAVFIAFLSPMRSVLIWATALAVIFSPRNEKLALRFGSRNRAALVTVVIAVVTVMAPVTIVAYLSREQFLQLVGGMSDAVGHLPMYLGMVQDGIRNVTGITINLADQAQAAASLRQLESALSNLALQFGGAAATQAAEILSTLYVLFFFLRDGRSILAFITGLLPLQQDHKDQLSVGVVSVVNATLRGTIIVCAVQAGVAGIFYYFLGVKIWALLAAITFVICLMPAVGSGAVYIPVAIYFLTQGQIIHFWIMLLGGIFVIGMIDNFLRPRLIGQQTALPEVVIFLMSFGGLFLLGIDGLLLGPIIAKLFIDLWTIYVTSAIDPDGA